MPTKPEKKAVATGGKKFTTKGPEMPGWRRTNWNENRLETWAGRIWENAKLIKGVVCSKIYRETLWTTCKNEDTKKRLKGIYQNSQARRYRGDNFHRAEISTQLIALIKPLAVTRGFESPKEPIHRRLRGNFGQRLKSGEKTGKCLWNNNTMADKEIAPEEKPEVGKILGYEPADFCLRSTNRLQRWRGAGS